MTHHSLHLAENGNIWVPGRLFQTGESEFPPVSAPYNDDLLLEVSPGGEILREISVLEVIFQNELLPLFLANGQRDVTARPEAETVHLNDIEELSTRLADAFPLFSPGDLALSFRHYNLIMVLDPESLEVKWHRTGPYVRQHDPDFQPDGTLTVFDNQTDEAKGVVFGGSRILKVDPVTGDVSTLYGGRGGESMYTPIRGRHEVLENGNLLITEALAGRIFEVTPDGIIVWEYINRFDEDEVARVSDALRYPEGYFRVQDWSCN
jgi:hypothetical protein